MALEPTLPPESNPLEDENDRAVIGGNNPPEPLPYDQATYAALDATTQQFVDVSNMWTKVKISSEAEARQLNDQITGLQKVWDNVEAARKAAKDPWFKKAKQVDEVFGGLKAKLEASIAALKPVLAKYQQIKKDELEAKRIADIKAARAKEEEARRLAMDAANSDKIEDQVAADEAAKAAAKQLAAAEKPVDASIKSASGAGRTMSERTRRVARIDNIRITFMHFQSHPKVIEVLQSLANAEANAAGFGDDGKVPGCTIEKITTLV